MSCMASTVWRCSSSAAARTASNWRLIAAEPAPAVSATTRAMSRARSSAAASDSSSRPVKRDSRWSRSVVRRSMVVTSDSSAALRSATEVVVLRLLCSTTARPRPAPCRARRTGVDSEPRSSSALRGLVLKTLSWSSSVCVAAPLREVTSFIAETKSATRVTSARSSELRLSWAPVSTSCSRMLPSRSRSNSATVSVRRILLVSCISVTAAIETWRDWSIAAREACSRSFSDLPTAPVAISPADVDGARDIGAVAHHRLRERLAAGLDRLQRVGGDAVDVDRELAGLGADRLHQRAALAVDHLRQAVGLLLHIGDDLVGLAGHGLSRSCWWRRAPSARRRPRST